VWVSRLRCLRAAWMLVGCSCLDVQVALKNHRTSNPGAVAANSNCARGRENKIPALAGFTPPLRGVDVALSRPVPGLALIDKAALSYRPVNPTSSRAWSCVLTINTRFARAQHSTVRPETAILIPPHCISQY